MENNNASTHAGRGSTKTENEKGQKEVKTVKRIWLCQPQATQRFELACL